MLSPLPSIFFLPPHIIPASLTWALQNEWTPTRTFSARKTLPSLGRLTWRRQLRVGEMLIALSLACHGTHPG